MQVSDEAPRTYFQPKQALDRPLSSSPLSTREATMILKHLYPFLFFFFLKKQNFIFIVYICIPKQHIAYFLSFIKAVSCSVRSSVTCCFPPFKIICLRFILVMVRGRVLSFSAGAHCMLRVHHHLLIHTPFDGQLGWIQCFCNYKKWFYEYFVVCTHIWVSMRYTYTSRMARSQGIGIFNFVGQHQIIFQCVCPQNSHFFHL